MGEAEPRSPGIRPWKQDPKARKVQSEDEAEEKPKGMRGRAGKGLRCLQTAGAGDKAWCHYTLPLQLNRVPPWKLAGPRAQPAP